MKIPISELEGDRLDKWVALARGWIVKVSQYNDYSYHYYSSEKDIPADSTLVKDYRPSINGWQAMALVKEFKLHLYAGGIWEACPDDNATVSGYGPTPEIAICRAVVAAKFGVYVEEEE